MPDTATSTRTAASIIGGEQRTDAPGGRLESTNPALLSEVVADVLLTDAQGFEDAARAARAGQRAWAAVPAPARGRVIAQVGRLVEANKEALARLVTREIGKPYAESLGEVQEIIDTCDFFVGEGRRLYGQTVPSEMPDKQLFTFRMPVGVAAIVTAGNFPVAVPSWYLVPAILCGNAVVWKPAEYAAATGSALAQLFHAGGVPGDVLNLVHADGAQTFAGLERALEHRLVDKVGFTGSSAVGAEIGALCGRNLQSPCLELGGKNPMVVMDDADLDLAVEGALFAGFGTAGQRCTSLGTAIVQEGVHDEFVRRLDARLQAAAVGDPTQRRPLRPDDPRALRRALRGVARAHPRSPHALRLERAGPDRRRRAACGLRRRPGGRALLSPDVRHGRARRRRPLRRRRRSGRSSESPASPTSTRRSSWPTATATGSPRRSTRPRPLHAFRFRERISAGMVSINNSTSGAEAHLPFGGNGKSGNGSRQSGIWVLDQFTRWQSVNWDYAGKLQKAQMDVAEIEAVADFRLEERAF